MSRPRRRQRRGRAPTQRNRRRRVDRRLAHRPSRLAIRPTERQCREAGLHVYRITALRCPSFFLWNEFEVWKRVVASPSVLGLMAEGRQFGLRSAHSTWSNGEEMSGRYFEYRFRLKYPLPIHIPPTAMKLVALFAANDYDEMDWDGPELWELDR